MKRDKIIDAIRRNCATEEEAEAAIRRYEEETEIYKQRESEIATEKRREEYYCRREQEEGTLPCLSYLDDIRAEDTKTRKKKYKHIDVKIIK